MRETIAPRRSFTTTGVTLALNQDRRTGEWHGYSNSNRGSSPRKTRGCRRHPAGFIGTFAPRILAGGKIVRSDTEFIGAQAVTGTEFARSPVYDFDPPIMVLARRFAPTGRREPLGGSFFPAISLIFRQPVAARSKRVRHPAMRLFRSRAINPADCVLRAFPSPWARWISTVRLEAQTFGDFLVGPANNEKVHDLQLPVCERV